MAPTDGWQPAGGVMFAFDDVEGALARAVELGAAVALKEDGLHARPPGVSIAMETHLRFIIAKADRQKHVPYRPFSGLHFRRVLRP